MIKIAIIDDDNASIEALVQMLKAFDDTTIVGKANNGTKGISLVRQEQPDMLFLDVEMPDMTGLEFLSQMKSIQEHPCQVIIYTAHEKYMLQAFRDKAFDFLLKPASMDELTKVMQRYHMETALPPTPEQKDPDKLLFYINASDFRIVNTSDVFLFQYNHEQRSWEVFFSGREAPVRLKRSTNNESLLAMSPHFIQVSQRHIININYLMEVSDGICRFYPPFDHFNHVKVGRAFRKQLTDRFATL